MGKIMKNLANLLRNTVLASSMAIPLVFGGCCKENYAPEAKLEVNPLYGEAPLPVRMKLTGHDLNGDEDIKNYRLNIGSEVINSNTPIDITRTFDNPGNIKVYGEVIDSKNANDKTVVNSIEVYRGPFIEQSASLIDSVNIKYSAILSKVNSAELKINKDDALFITKNINDVNQTGIDYEKTFNYALDGVTKGNYEFILKSGNLEKRDSVNVPNYKPTVGSIIPVNFLEETDTTITLLSNFWDKNPEDISNIAYQSVDTTTSDLKTKVTLLTGNKLKIEGLPNQTGAYQIEIEFGSTAGGLEKAVIQGNIIKDTRIEINPFVQPNDSTLNWYGSGDVNNNNIVNSQDLIILDEIIKGSYTNPNPSDKRLMDRADVNGDGTVNNYDAQLLGNKLKGSIPYLPGGWNKLLTRAEREDWLEKMLKIDLTSETSFPGCQQYSDQTYINFHGFKKIEDISGLLQDDPNHNLNLSDNGRFNLPLYELVASYYDLNWDPSKDGHAMNTIVLGDSALSWNDLSNVEPQDDRINIKVREAPFIGTNIKIYIQGPPTARVDYIYYTITNNTPNFIKTNPNIKLITQRGK